MGARPAEATPCDPPSPGVRGPLNITVEGIINQAASRRPARRAPMAAPPVRPS
jgi:hypothetical protein